MKRTSRVLRRLRDFYRLPGRVDLLQEALGRIESRLNEAGRSFDPRDHEFKVYSQWGEDGIIDYLVRHISVPVPSFVEFGVEDYTEANTLFLLKHRGWRGLVIDGSPDNVAAIRSGRVLWKHDLYAECEFITRDNINPIIERNGFSGDAGLLSIDIDGNDYWIWQAIDVIRPRIVVAEYNSLFGAVAKVSTPYRDDFQRHRAHPTNMYYGASLAALDHLGRSRGYSLVAGNSAGNNAFFVRDDCLGPLRVQPVEKAYVRAAFREARGSDGQVELLDFAARQRAIAGLPVVDVESGTQMPLKDAL